MSRKTLPLTQQLYEYLLSTSLREAPVLIHLRQETSHMPGAQMIISPEQGQFMALLLKLMQAKNVLEIGTFTGYASLVMAQALPQYGRIITCDIDEKATQVAQNFWAQAGCQNKITLRLGPAVDTLDEMIEQDQHGMFDFIFIDADKKAYLDYYEKSYHLLKKGGLIAVDNVFLGGKVADQNCTDPQTGAMRAFNDFLKEDLRIDLSMVPIGDGLLLAYKR